MSRYHTETSKIDNPCFEEQNQTFKCMEDNDNDTLKCGIYFDNYKICRRFWDMISNDRERKGISPAMPTLEERQKIKEQRHQLM